MARTQIALSAGWKHAMKRNSGIALVLVDDGLKSVWYYRYISNRTLPIIYGRQPGHLNFVFRDPQLSGLALQQGWFS